MRRLLTALAACLLLAGCGAADPPPPEAAGLPSALVGYPGAEVTVEDTSDHDGVTVSTVRYRLSRGDGTSLDVDLRFPQVSGIPEADAVNLMLLDAALQTTWGDVTAANAAAKFQGAEQTGPGPDLCGEADYTLLSCGGGTLSVLFSGKNVYSNGINVDEQPVTIDLETASWVDVVTFTYLNVRLHAIRRGWYQVLSGHYLPGGWVGPEMADDFADALTEQVYGQDWYGGHPDRVPGTPEVETADGPVAYSEFALYSGRNFGIDGENFYLRFPFADSLDGYVLLQVPRTAPPPPLPREASSLPLAMTGYSGAEVTVEDTADYDGMTVSTVRYFLVREDEHQNLYVDLRFPRVSGIPEADTVNLMLLDAALQTTWWDVTAANAAAKFREAEQTADSPGWTGLCGEADYTLLSCGGGRLSVLFSGENWYSNGANAYEQPVTIDLETASWVDVPAFTDLDTLLSDIRSGGYEVLSGGYQPGGWEGPEMADDFADALAEQADPAYWRDEIGVDLDLAPGTAEVETADGPVEYPHFTQYPDWDFGVDDEAVYLQFSFYDSLDGYVLLKIPRPTP